MVDGSLIQSAHSALAAGEKVRAQKLLAQVLKAAPDDADAWLLMAEAQTDPQRRQDCLDRASRLASSARPAPTLLVSVSVPVAVPAPAAPVAAPSSPASAAPSPETLLDQAIGAYNDGDRAESERLLALVIKREPRNADAWALRAEIQFNPGRKRQFAERAHDLNPANELAKAILAELGPEPSLETSFAQPEPARAPERVQPPSVGELLAIAARQELDDPQMEPRPAGVESPFFLAWFIALTNPTRAGYEALRDDPQASIMRGSVWIVLTGLVYIATVFATQLSSQLAVVGVSDISLPVLAAVTVIVAVIGSLGVLLSLYLSSLVVSLTAGALGGEGNYRDQFYLSATYLAPLQLVQAALVTIPTAGLFLSFGLSLYTFWLSINATRVAQDISALRALFAQILPGILIFGAAVCAAITLAPSLPR